MRSFEGSDPTTTMYLVFAPFVCNAQELHAAKKNGPRAIELCDDPTFLLGLIKDTGEPDPTLRLRLYRLKNAGEPEDVTATLLPPLPSLTMAERRRYYRYGGARLDDKGRSRLPNDTDLVMWTGSLQYAPTLRWWLELDPDLGPAHTLPESDPRWLGREAHFGFLIWNGLRFEMRERVSRSFVPCGVLDSGTIDKCIPGTNPYVREDRFIIEDK